MTSELYVTLLLVGQLNQIIKAKKKSRQQNRRESSLSWLAIYNSQRMALLTHGQKEECYGQLFKLIPPVRIPFETTSPPAESYGQRERLLFGFDSILCASFVWFCFLFLLNEPPPNGSFKSLLNVLPKTTRIVCELFIQSIRSWKHFVRGRYGREIEMIWFDYDLVERTLFVSFLVCVCVCVL